MEESSKCLTRGNSNYKVHILVIVSVAIFLRIFSAYFIGNKFHPQTWEYETLALSMLEGKGYVFDYREYGEYKALLSPGYSFLTYGVYMIFGVSHKLMLAVQFLLMTAFGLTIWGIARRFFDDPHIPLLAGLLAVLHPGILYYSVANLHQMTLYLPLFYGSMLLLCMLHSNGKWLHALLLGVVGGLAVLTRATILPVLVLGLIVFTVTAGDIALRKRCLQSFAVFSLIIAVNAPWAIRNRIVLDTLIFSQSNKWEAFWVGNNPNASGGHQRADGSLVLQTKPPEMQAEIEAAKGDELAVETIFRKHAFKFAKEHPFTFIRGLVRKTFYFWWFYPHTGILYPKIYLVFYKILYVCILAFTFYGLYICHKNRLWVPEMLYPALLVLGIWGVHAINFMETRHRWTVEPVMLIFVALALVRLLKMIIVRSQFQNSA